MLIEKKLRRKSAPDSFILGAEMLGVSPKKILAFEDSVSGVRAAIAAGMDVVCVYDKNSDHDRAVLESLTPYHINSYKEFAEQNIESRDTSLKPIF